MWSLREVLPTPGSSNRMSSDNRLDSCAFQQIEKLDLWACRYQFDRPTPCIGEWMWSKEASRLTCLFIVVQAERSQFWSRECLPFATARSHTTVLRSISAPFSMILKGLGKPWRPSMGSNLHDQCCRPRFCNGQGDLTSSVFFSRYWNRLEICLRPSARGGEPVTDGRFNLLVGSLSPCIMDHFIPAKGWSMKKRVVVSFEAINRPHESMIDEGKVDDLMKKYQWDWASRACWSHWVWGQALWIQWLPSIYRTSAPGLDNNWG